MNAPDDTMECVSATAEVVAAYVSYNSIRPEDLGTLIASVHATLTDLGRATDTPAKPVPPVPVRKSYGDDFIISMEDGRRYKSLKRHLAGRGLTPQQYREKWGLPYDYPMVAASYARQRSELAKSMGLGRRKPETAPAKARRRASAG